MTNKKILVVLLTLTASTFHVVKGATKNLPLVCSPALSVAVTCSRINSCEICIPSDPSSYDIASDADCNAVHEFACPILNCCPNNDCRTDELISCFLQETNADLASTCPLDCTTDGPPSASFGGLPNQVLDACSTQVSAAAACVESCNDGCIPTPLLDATSSLTCENVAATGCEAAECCKDQCASNEIVNLYKCVADNLVDLTCNELCTTSTNEGAGSSSAFTARGACFTVLAMAVAVGMYG